jgi:adenosylcobinamide kinase/adenosylcobinamide-phosphate guanylyltransferase
MTNDLRPGHTLILGGQKSGKSRAAEGRAAAWLAGGAGRRAVLLATAQAGDAEMAARIQRHRTDRAARVPGLATQELAGADGRRTELADALRAASQPGQLVVVDCLTLWLTQLAMPLHGPAADEAALQRATDQLLAALQAAPGPVVLVSNEIGLGVSPLLAPVRRFIDALGRLHQQLAEVCDRVTLMVAGCEIVAKPAVAA